MLLEHQDVILEFCSPSRWKELSKETSSKILPGGDGSCRKTFKPIARASLSRVDLDAIIRILTPSFIEMEATKSNNSNLSNLAAKLKNINGKLIGADGKPMMERMHVSFSKQMGKEIPTKATGETKKDGLSLIATQIGNPIMLDAFISSMCVESWGRISFARALFETSLDKEIKEEVVIAIPVVNDNGYTKATVRVEGFYITTAKSGVNSHLKKDVDNVPFINTFDALKDTYASNDVGSITDDNDSEEVENVFMEDNGKPVYNLVDDARNKVEAPPKKSPRKTGIMRKWIMKMPIAKMVDGLRMVIGISCLSVEERALLFLKAQDRVKEKA
ncbi:hypothetical protein Tco_0944690 [Tanacetum coccineum]